MRQSLEIDRDQLRKTIALEYDQAAKIKEWCEIPPELDLFPEWFGKVCHPVYMALCRFYDARKRCGERLAAGHQHCGDTMNAFDGAMQCADEGDAAGAPTWSSQDFRTFLSSHGAGAAGVEIS